ncbi:MAG: hypothetical protein M3Y75_02345, partial [Actinomycetota bacterium]|nr:hypothetical protein [Actinomycetota bacterium]
HDWVDALVGTEVEIAFDPERIFTHTRHGTNSVGAFLEEIASFYRLAEPEVAFIDRSDPDRPTSIAPLADHPGATGELPPLWRRIECEDFDDVTWHPQAGDVGRLAHNGILIQDPDFPAAPAYGWSDPRLQAFLTRPPISIYDSRHTLGINLQRYGLTEQTLPFERQLVESIGADIVAYSLTFPLDVSRYPLQARAGDSPIFTETGWMPALPPLVQRYSRGPVLVLWLFPFFLPETYSSAVRTKGTPFWKTFPLRMRVMTEPNISPTVNALEKALLAVEQNAERWAKLFGATELTSIVAPGESAEEVVQLHRGEEFESVGEGWRAIYTGRKGPDPHTYVRKTENAAAEVERALLTLSNDFLSDARWPLVALSVFECSAVEPSPLEPLAAPWIRAIGGDLSRNRAAASEARKAAVNADPELRFLLEGWERTSAAGLATQ